MPTQQTPNQHPTQNKAAPVTPSSKKRDPLLLNIALNILIPTLILSKLSTDAYLGPVFGLIIALAFPIVYGIYDMVIRKKTNVMSVIGVVSIVLTGVIGIIQLPPTYIAIKEGAVPLVIGILVLLSAKSKKPLIQLILDEVLDHEKIQNALHANESKNSKTPSGPTPATHLTHINESQIRYDAIVRVTSYIMAASFLCSAILNYGLAKWVVVSEPGSEAFNSQIAKMTLLSYPVIVVPSLVVLSIGLVYMITQLTKLTGMSAEELINR